jgi:excisionase family DNA binding protein
MPNELLTSTEAARRLGCSRRTVHRLVTSKDLTPAHKLTGQNGAFLFDPAEVDELARQRGIAVESAA